MYVAPREGHGWRELRHRLFKANVELDWFERWVMEREYEWEEAPFAKTEDKAKVISLSRPAHPGHMLWAMTEVTADILSRCLRGDPFVAEEKQCGALRRPIL